MFVVSLENSDNQSNYLKTGVRQQSQNINSNLSWRLKHKERYNMSFRLLPNGNISMIFLKAVQNLETQIKFLDSSHISQTASKIQT